MLDMAEFEALQERRRKLISALRGEIVNSQGNPFEKGTGQLVCKHNSFANAKHCCIGVGCSLLEFKPVFKVECNEDIQDEWHDEYDDQQGYGVFRDEYEVTSRVCSYLMAMNDGDYRPLGEKYPNRYCSTEMRSFSFIARFLEIIWQLTPVEESDGE